MKKMMALLMAVVLCLSVFVLSGCKDKENDAAKSYLENYGFDAHVDTDADILGKWQENLSEDAKSDKTIWIFESSTTLNIIENIGSYSLTVGCAYNFDKDTSKLTYLVLDTKKEYIVTVSIDGDSMTFTDESGEIVKSFTKE